MSFKENIPLKSYSTIEIGGPARFLIEAFSKKDLQEALKFAMSKGIPYYILGRGSNTLFDDQGFNGVVIVNRFSSIVQKGEGRFVVASGTSLPLVSMKTATQGWGGLEWALGIPGSVGGAVAMNAGASKSDISSVIEEVLFLHSSGEEQIFLKKEIAFGYRSSPFQKLEGIILEATFHLYPCRDARANQLHLFQNRRKTQPYHEPSLGCVFQNPENFSCGRIIDELGLKGFQQGGAHISPLHGNFITNPKGGTSHDVKALIQMIEEKVSKEKNLTLKKEIRIVPYTL